MPATIGERSDAVLRTAMASETKAFFQRLWAGMAGAKSALNLLPLAQRNVAHGAGREQLFELDPARGQALLESVLQQRLDGRPVLLDPVGVPVAPDDRLLLLDHRLQPGEGRLGRPGLGDQGIAMLFGPA